MADRQAVAVTSWRERDRRWWAVVLTSGIAEPLVHVVDRLTQVTLTVVRTQQALLHKSFRDFDGGSLVEVAGPNRTLKDRQNPDQHVGIAVLHRVRRRKSLICGHATTMPGGRAFHPSPGPARIAAQLIETEQATAHGS